MALEARSNPWLSRLHFLVRLLALVGLLAAGVALVESLMRGRLSSWQGAWNYLVEGLTGGLATADPVTRYIPWVFAVGAGLAAFGLLIELIVLLRTAAARRSAAGANAMLQIGLSAALLIVVNWYSAGHHARFDFTRDGRFTLKPEEKKKLQQLQGDTTIAVVLKPARGNEADARLESYQAAADAVVVNKVLDLADMLRDFGPQFRVVVLNATDANFQDRVNKLLRSEDELKEIAKEDKALLEKLESEEKRLKIAIEQAPTSSIVFHARGKVGTPAQVQRIAFDDFYQLDRKRSLDPEPGKKVNLVLLNKGIGPLTNRIFNLEEKRPRVGILVVHPVLSSGGDEDGYTLEGMKKALTRHGFEVRDVVVKRNLGGQARTGWTWETAADTLEEIDYESLQSELDELPETIRQMERQVKLWGDAKRKLEKAKPADLGLTEEERKSEVEFADRQLTAFQALVSDRKEQLKKKKEELASINADVIGEQRRMSDTKGKLERMLADCDLLFVPRLTIQANGRLINDPASLYRLDDVHLQAIKDFLKRGKPLLATLGPVIEPGVPRFPPLAGTDGLEELLGELSIRLGKQTIVYDVQTEEYARRRANPFLSDPKPIKEPPIDFTTALDRLQRPRPGEPAAVEENPLRRSLRWTTAAQGEEMELRMRFPRPVYYDADEGKGWKRHQKPLTLALLANPVNPLAGVVPGIRESVPREPLQVAPEFLWTPAECWNDDQPLPTQSRPVPRFEPPKEDDPTRGTIDERRKGPFPIGVAVEAKLPEKWYPDVKGDRTAPVAVIGSGSIFVDKDLSPARQQLLLDTCNWLMKRDDLLTQKVEVWEYPRVVLDPDPKRNEEAKTRWRVWAWAGLPVFFLFLGVVVLLSRQVR